MASHAESRQLIERMRSAWEQVGKWLSAALYDPKVCDEMKRDVRIAMAVFHPHNRTGQDAKFRSFGAAYGAGPQTMKRIVREAREKRGDHDDAKDQPLHPSFNVQGTLTGRLRSRPATFVLPKPVNCRCALPKLIPSGRLPGVLVDGARWVDDEDDH